MAGLHGASSVTQGSAATGAVRFSAPELFLDSCRPSLASDVYAFGCLCLEVILNIPHLGSSSLTYYLTKVYSGKPPFSEIPTEAGVLGQLIAGVHPKRPKLSRATLPGFWEFIEQCWSTSPGQRPDSASLLTSLPLQEPVISIDEIKSLFHAKSKAPKVIFLWRPWRPYPSRSTSLRALDPCLISLIRIDSHERDHAVNVVNRLVNSEFGWPTEVVEFTKDRWLRAIPPRLSVKVKLQSYDQPSSPLQFPSPQDAISPDSHTAESLHFLS